MLYRRKGLCLPVFLQNEQPSDVQTRALFDSGGFLFLPFCLQNRSEPTRLDVTHPGARGVGCGIQVAMVRVILTSPEMDSGGSVAGKELSWAPWQQATDRSPRVGARRCLIDLTQPQQKNTGSLSAVGPTGESEMTVFSQEPLLLHHTFQPPLKLMAEIKAQKLWLRRSCFGRLHVRIPPPAGGRERALSSPLFAVNLCISVGGGVNLCTTESERETFL